MRYDTEVRFQLITDVYNADGDYTESVEKEHIEYASLIDTDIQTMLLVYGKIKQGSVTMSLQNKVNYAYDRVSIDGKPYTVDQCINLRNKQAFILSEWQE